MLLTFDCDSPAIIIGKEGHTLESIQYIITLIVSRYFDNPISVICDTQNYWRKLEDKVNEEIERAVKMLMRTKKTYRFRPMSAQRRRYIHRYLVDRTDISTVSEGEGKWRKVVLKLQTVQKAQPANTNPQEDFNAQINQAVSYGQDTQEALRKMQEEQAKAAMAEEQSAQAEQAAQAPIQTEQSEQAPAQVTVPAEIAPVQTAEQTPVQTATETVSDQSAQAQSTATPAATTEQK